MSMELPNTQVECAGCDEPLNVLAPYLHFKMAAKRDVLVIEEVPSEDPNEVGDPNIYLGSKTGRGVVKAFHDFDCMSNWVDERKGLPAKIEFHAEEGDPYVPEDNPDDEELARRAEAAAEAEAAAAEGDEG